MHKTVSGVVVDINNEPLIGVNVTVKGDVTLGAITDFDGKWTLSVPSSKSTLVFSYIGYTSQEVTIGNQTNIKVTLKEDAQALDEVVVVGYGTMKKSDLTGSIASVSSEKIAARGSLRVEDALQGAVPGVNITQSSSRANSGFDIQIRGQSSINNAASPLYVVDGVVVSSIDYLNPEDIARIDVLKDASSTAIYGSRASSGVILIATKGTGNQAKAQPVEISYDGYYGVRKVARMPDFMDSREFVNYRFQRYTLGGPTADGTGKVEYTISDGNLKSAFQATSGDQYKESILWERFMNNETYDWASTVLRTVSQQNHFLSASGATEKTNFHQSIEVPQLLQFANPHFNAFGFQRGNQFFYLSFIIMIRVENERLYHTGSMKGLFDGHSIGLVHRQESDVYILQVTHFGNVFRITGYVDALVFDVQNVPVVASFGVELLSVGGNVVSGNGFNHQPRERTFYLPIFVYFTEA